MKRTLVIFLVLSWSQRSSSSQDSLMSVSPKKTLKQNNSLQRNGSEVGRGQRSNTPPPALDLSNFDSLLKWKEVTGHLQFEKQGQLIPTAKMGHLVINVDLWKVQTEVWRRLDRMREFRPQTWTAETSRARKWLQTIITTLGMKPTKDRTGRDVVGALGTILGVFNYWQSRDHTELEDRIKKALKQTATRVDALDNWQRKQTGTLTEMIKLFKKMDKEIQAREVLVEWMHLEHQMQALLSVVTGLGHGKLHPAILELATLFEVLPRFLEHQRRLNLLSPLSNYLEVLACPISHWTQGYMLRIVLHVPFQQSGHRPADLYFHRQVPLGSQHNLTIWAITSGKWLIVDGERSAEIQQQDLVQCTRLGNSRYCTHLAAAFSSSRGSCLGALWAGDWETVRSRCPLISHPALPGAWQMGAGRVVLQLPEPALLLVQCPDGRSSHEILQGYGLISVPEGCRAVSDELEILGPGGELEEKEAVQIEVNASSWEILTPELHRVTNLNISRPETMTSLADDVQKILQKKPLLNWFTALALILALIAVLVCAAFLLYVYCRFKIAQRAAEIPTQTSPTHEEAPIVNTHVYDEPDP